MSECRLEEVKDLITDLEYVISDFEQSYELHKLMMRSTERANPSEALCMQSYRDVQLISNVLFDRLNDEVARFNSIFNKLHELTAC